MNHDMPKSPEHASRDQVLEAYRKLIEKGAASAFSLDEDDPEVKKARELEKSWRSSAGNDAQANFEQTTLFMDAGFTDPEDLDTVWEELGMDLDDLDESDTELREKIVAKRTEISQKLGVERDNSCLNFY